MLEAPTTLHSATTGAIPSVRNDRERTRDVDAEEGLVDEVKALADLFRNLRALTVVRKKVCSLTSLTE